MKVFAIFDIGKTNKKLFLLNKNYEVVKCINRTFDEIEDEDGFPCDDLVTIQEWVLESVVELVKDSDVELLGVNFSTYGASLVHIDEHGNILTPFYNYLKPYPEEILEQFRSIYGDILHNEDQPDHSYGMLNTGLQLYRLKTEQPHTYKKIHKSLHFSQYLSYLFTGKMYTDPTQLGCHTGLWDFDNNCFQNWVLIEKIDQKIPSLAPTETVIPIEINNKRVLFGVGVHDTSSALISYLKKFTVPFILISTGTWCITINPFEVRKTKSDELKKEWPNLMLINGQPINPKRSLLGKEHEYQVTRLNKYYQVSSSAHKGIRFQPEVYDKIGQITEKVFDFKYIESETGPDQEPNFDLFHTHTEAYHRLMHELMEVQLRHIEEVKKTSQSIKVIFVDGGFASNDIFMSILKKRFPLIDVRSETNMGSALGAAMLLAPQTEWTQQLTNTV